MHLAFVADHSPFHDWSSAALCPSSRVGTTIFASTCVTTRGRTTHLLVSISDAIWRAEGVVATKSFTVGKNRLSLSRILRFDPSHEGPGLKIKILGRWHFYEGILCAIKLKDMSTVLLKSRSDASVHLTCGGGKGE
eukprot:SAG31_NODE_5716_length_2365_cov_1.864960_2_plen_136_part_00